MLNNLLRALDIFGVFNITCSYCGRSKSGKHYTIEGKKFCKQSCANKYLKAHGTKVCAYCQKRCGINDWTNDEIPGKYFCKEKCLEKYYYREPCEFCNNKHGTRVYRHQGYEFGSKECKERYLARKKMLKS